MSRSTDLHMRPLSGRDGAAFFRLIDRNREHLLAYFPYTLREIQSERAARNYVARLENQEHRSGSLYRVLEQPSTSELYGFVAVKNIDPTVAKGEVDYFIDQTYTGMGLATRMVRELVAEAFGKKNLHKLYLYADDQNAASCRVAEKVGFRQEGLLREDYRTGQGDLVNTRYYGLLRREWELRAGS